MVLPVLPPPAPAYSLAPLFTSISLASGADVVWPRARGARVRSSYARASIMQAALAIVGCVIGLIAAWSRRDPMTAIAAALLGLVVPFT